MPILINIVFTVLNKEEEAIKLLKELPYVNNIKVDEKKITANVTGNDEDLCNLLKYLILNVHYPQMHVLIFAFLSLHFLIFFVILH